MRVKKTKKGSYAFVTTYELRDDIFSAVVNFLEDESVKLIGKPITREAEVMQHLYCSTLDQLIRRKDFSPQWNNEIKWTITHTEAIALMWLLRHYDENMALLDLKSNLYKQLQS